MSDYLPINTEALIHYKKDKDFEQDFEQAEIRWVDSDGKTQKTYLPAYEDESPERLLYNTNENAKSVYSFWHRVVKGAARDTWDAVLGDQPIADQSKTWQTFDIHVGFFYKEYFDKDATFKQKEYLKNTKKPKDMTVRQWIRRMKTINQYVDLMKKGEKFTEEKLIEECITPNLPHSWRKDFMMGNGHTLKSTNDVASKLAILEKFYYEHDNKKKKQNNRVNKYNNKSSRGKRSDSQKFKNKCRKHPDGNHEWKDCMLNPNSKNYKGDSYNKKRNNKHESNAIDKKKSPKKASNKNDNESDDEISDSDNSCYAMEPDNKIEKAVPKQKQQRISAELLFQIGDKNFIALADSGTSSSLAISDVTDLGTKIEDSKQSDWVTQGGDFSTKGIYEIEKAFLPQFTKRRHFSIKVHKINSKGESLYDIILGRDFLSQIGLDLLYSTEEFQWGEIKIRMTPRGHWNKTTINDYESENIPAEENFILDSKYEEINIEGAVEQLAHLSAEEKKLLTQLLLKHKDMFKGTLGAYKGPKVALEFKEENTEPIHVKPYRIPHAIRPTLKKEIDRLCDIGVLKENPNSKWAFPSFAIPKKDGRIRFISDFRLLNKHLRRKPFPLPHIRDTLDSIGHFRYATVIDLSMGYYHIKLNDLAQDICTIILPWGKYSYTGLPMGLSPSSDIFQHAVDSLFTDLEHVQCYIDDLCCYGNGTYEEHLDDLDEVLGRLHGAGFQANPLKTFWAQQSVEYLGFIISRDGIKPQPKKIKGLLNIAPPKNKKQLRGFIGMVNFYKDMFRQRAHILKPLTEKTGKGTKFEWTKEMDESFNEMKKIIAEDTMLAFPTFGETFHVHTDASDYQMGGVVSQKGTPIAFFSKKLNTAQKKYTTTEKELLSIVETLRHFKTILFGQKIKVHTDHRNLTYDNSDYSSDRVLRQRLLLEEYGAELLYIKGENNVVADALSRLPLANTESQPEESFALRRVFEDSILCPVDFLQIQKHQKEMPEWKQIGENPKLKLQKYGRTELLTFTHKNRTKILVPEALRNQLIEWYHENLRHPGEKRMYLTMSQFYGWKGMKQNIAHHVKHCHQCQTMKKGGKKKYGHLPLKDNVNPDPFEDVQVDLIGPWKVEIAGRNNNTTNRVIKAFHIMDTGTGLSELIPILDKKSKNIANLFDEEWLCRYPRPIRCIFDNGTEFTGYEFQEMLRSYGIKPAGTTVKNPQSNAVLERVHLSMGDQLRVTKFTHHDWDKQIKKICASVSWALRSTTSSVHGYTPGQLAFQRDMIMQTKIIADWDFIHKKKMEQAKKANIRENAARIQHQYKIGDLVLVVIHHHDVTRKLKSPTTGPFPITKINNNGTVEVWHNGYKEVMNIRRLRPYYQAA